jgi:hypothetical protein
MGWFGNRTRQPNGKRLPSSTMTAAGSRMDLADHDIIRQIVRTKMGWQTHAWDYRDLIGELSGALRFRANVISKVGLTIAQVTDGDDVPVDADSPHATLEPAVRKAAQDALNKLPWRSGYMFGGLLDTNFSVAGEAWLHGLQDKGKEKWTVLSTDEVQPLGGGSNLGIVDLPGQPARPINPKTEVLIRLWVPHPRFKRLADSPMRSCIDVCMDILLIGRELRAAARSRVAANGLLLVPHSLSMVRHGPNSDEDRDFQTELEAALLAPITNEGEPGSVVPIAIEGDIEDLKEVRHIQLVRETSADLNEKLTRSLTRLGESIDVPPTVMTGLQDTNHWNAYVIDATTFTNHIEPGVRIMVDSLTEGYLRPSLTMPTTQGGYGLSDDQAATVQVWYDAGKVVQNANRGSDAKDAYDRLAIGPKSLREALGFNDGDAPTTEELMTMIASKISVDPGTAGQLVSRVLGIPAPPTPAPTPPAPRPQLPPGESPRNPGTGSVPVGQPNAPDIGARTASAAIDASLRIVTADRLAAIDAALLDRLTTAADAAIRRAVEKAQARIRSAAQHHVSRPELTAHADDLAAWLGPERVAELGVLEDALLAAAFDYLAEKFAKWTVQAIGQAVRVVANMTAMPLTATAALTRAMTARVPAAWSRLQAALHQRTLNALYGRTGQEQRGEATDELVRPGDIRTALATIGGTDADEGGRSATSIGGIGLGQDVLDTVEQVAGPPIGLMWIYGPEPRDTFEPHLRLDDHRYDSPTDRRLTPPAGYEWLGAYMHPGDHAGCRCHTAPAWIFPENAASMDPGLRDLITRTVSAGESAAMRNERALAEMDDAAGRTGTTAQRARDQADRVKRLRDEWLGAA